MLNSSDQRLGVLIVILSTEELIELVTRACLKNLVQTLGKVKWHKINFVTCNIATAHVL
jgi:hypothetical protein